MKGRDLVAKRSLRLARVYGLPEPAALLAPPLMAECYANLECRIADGRMAAGYNFFILEMIKA